MKRLLGGIACTTADMGGVSCDELWYCFSRIIQEQLQYLFRKYSFKS